MIPPALPTRRQAMTTCALAALTTLACAGLLTAATLAQAPVAVVPLLIGVCIGVPLAMAWSVPFSVAVLRTTAPSAGHREALSDMRDHLAQLPETRHPLGL